MENWSEYTQQSNEDLTMSNDLWDVSSVLQNTSSDLWLQDMTYEALLMQQASDLSESFSYEMEAQSWESYYGPINAEGYTAYDASMGYTSGDTSFIEPASAAGSCSMISDYSGASNL